MEFESIVQNYNNYFYGLRLFSPALALHDVDSISLNLASPAELLVTDPLDRRLGKDPITNIEYNEIPGGSYYQEGIGNPFAETPTPTKESKFIWIPNPLDGRYDIQVIGTDSGTYALDFSTYNNIGESTDASFEAVTDTGVISDYSIDYSGISEELTIIERIVNIKDVITEIEISYQLNLIDNNGIKNSLIKKLEYIHNNPLKAGLVNSPEEYPFSSYNHYMQTACPANTIIEIDKYQT